MRELTESEVQEISGGMKVLVCLLILAAMGMWAVE